MGISKIKKRDGRIVGFEQQKITDAIHKALVAVHLEDGEKAKKLSDEVVKVIAERFEKKIPFVEDVQDIVVEILRKRGYEKLADEYSTYRGKKAELRRLKKKFGIEVEPKLSVNALEVLKRRYLLKDEEGRTIESPAEMFQRVADRISQVDNLYGEDAESSFREFFEIMSKLEFLPNSPTLFNANAPLGQLSACFTSNQPILTNPDGFKPISEIEVGDNLITHRGRARKVTETFVRKIDEEIFWIDVKGLLKPTMTVTGTHPVLAVKRDDMRCMRDKSRLCRGNFASCFKEGGRNKDDCEYLRKPITRPRWIQAKELEKGDFVVVCSDGKVTDKEASPTECKKLVRAVGKNEHRKGKRSPQYVKLGGYTLRQISGVTKKNFSGEVFNLEVEEDHSYVANGIAVHNCFVLPVEDSLESIFSAVKNTALIEQTGGGVGFDFSRLRPEGDVVKSTKGVASGPVSFMRVFDTVTDVIKAGGKRRGAMMGILKVDHPDIEKFITSKTEEGPLSNFNISVAITDEFMEGLEEGGKYDLINPRTGSTVKRMNAEDVWNLIIKCAWGSGDPGVIFIDEINRHNPTPEVGEIEATNPCGEVPLLPNEPCNLGSINVSKMVKKAGGEAQIDWKKLENVVETSIHFLDNVIDANEYPIPEIEHMARANRKIGLGIMGWAELLIQLGIPYDSEEAIDKADEIMAFISEKARGKSEELGKERGSFPNFEKSIWREEYEAMRNATVTSIAPTGSISIIAGCSSSIEPLFSIAFMRDVLEGSRLFEVNPMFERTAKDRGFYSGGLMEKIAKSGSLQEIEEVPDDVKQVFVTALDISPDWHVKMQAAFQGHVDNAVSKTINLPQGAEAEDVEKVYKLAWRLKCKGITIYRYGSKSDQVLYIGETEREEKPGGPKFTSAVSEYSGGAMSGVCPVCG